MQPLRCFVYRGKSKTDTYLYLDRKDDFSQVPDAVLRHFGHLELVLEFDLTPQRRMARENPAEVYENLNTRGFHIQLPDDTLPTDEVLAH